MTTTIGNFNSEPSDWRQKLPRSRVYRTLGSATAGTMLMAEHPSEYQSTSMAPPRNDEPLHPIIVVYYVSTHEEESASTLELKARLSLPELWQHPEPDPRVWRGVFSPSYHPTVLFSQEITVHTANLPRRKPRVIIDRRTFARDEDE